MKYLIYDQDYLLIQHQDIPPAGNLIIAHDPQRRLSSAEIYITWVVVKTMGDGYHLPKMLGLFEDKEMAIFFAEALCDHENAI
jgi:hypothetical protein